MTTIASHNPRSGNRCFVCNERARNAVCSACFKLCGQVATCPLCIETGPERHSKMGCYNALVVMADRAADGDAVRRAEFEAYHAEKNAAMAEAMTKVTVTPCVAPPVVTPDALGRDDAMDELAAALIRGDISFEAAVAGLLG